MLAVLDGSCHTPVAALATIAGERLTITGLLLTPDGKAEIRARDAGAVNDAAAIGAALGEDMRRRAGPQFGLGTS
jgi:hydroxymethylbilane synthase